MLSCTEGTLLGGRVRYAQPRAGFRSGIEPVLLAAAIPVHAGERALEAGSGAGAGLLCLAARVPLLQAVGIELDAGLAELAAHNAALNGFPGLTFMAADITQTPELGLFDHAFANPPYHAASGTGSPDPSRAIAKRADPGLFNSWAASLASRLRHHGTLTFILTADVVPACLAGFAAAGCQPKALLPLWPRAGQPAKLVLVRGIKGGRSPFRVLPGLVLHKSGAGYTDEADAVLRGGATLDL